MRARPYRATRTFSPTVRSRKRRMFWKVRATPSRARTWGESPEIGRPRRCTSPAVGRQRPVTALKMVVLPAPFGPMIERISPSRTASETPETARMPPNRTERSRTSRTDWLTGRPRLRSRPRWPVAAG